MLTDILSKTEFVFRLTHFRNDSLGKRKVQAKLLWMQCISFFRLCLSSLSIFSFAFIRCQFDFVFACNIQSVFIFYFSFFSSFTFIYLICILETTFFSIKTTKYFPRDNKIKTATVSCTDCNIMLKYWKLCAKKKKQIVKTRAVSCVRILCLQFSIAKWLSFVEIERKRQREKEWKKGSTNHVNMWPFIIYKLQLWLWKCSSVSFELHTKFPFDGAKFI